jgi:uncharacterized protein with HEPN domain
MKDDVAYLQHIAVAIHRIRSYTSSGKDHFLSDSKTQDAVIRNLEVIGEAAKRLSETSRQAAPLIPWKQIAGMRDVLIHNYFGVQLDRVWQVVERDLTPLESAVNALLNSDGTSGPVVAAQ